MITVLREDWQEIISRPTQYITDEQDLALIRIIPKNNPNNATLVMVGQDCWDGRYLIVVEDNEVSEDIYPDGVSLKDMFMKILNDLIEADVLMDTLYEASANANVSLSIKDSDGNPVDISSDAITLINNILEQAYLPAMIDSIIAAGYHLVDKAEPSDWQVLAEKLIDEYISEDVVPAYQEYGDCVELDKDMLNLIHKILIHGYIPFVAKTTVNAGFVLGN